MYENTTALLTINSYSLAGSTSGSMGILEIGFPLAKVTYSVTAAKANKSEIVILTSMVGASKQLPSSSQLTLFCSVQFVDEVFDELFKP